MSDKAIIFSIEIDKTIGEKKQQNGVTLMRKVAKWSSLDSLIFWHLLGKKMAKLLTYRKSKIIELKKGH